MKKTTTITSITHEDLVNLLSTALYGGYYFGVKWNDEEYKALPNANKFRCIEDRCAELLLAGKSIIIYDMEVRSVKDHYGNLPYRYNANNDTMEYTITLEDIKRGLEKCFDDNDSYIRTCAMNLFNDMGDLDQPEAESLMQVIIFGELIYG